MASAPTGGRSRDVEGQLSPQQRRRRQTREEILDAATDVMAENGVAALNLTEVARRVGLRQPSLYQYFDSRTAVYDALFERGMYQHVDVLSAALGNAPDGLAALRAAAVATVRFAVEHPVLSQLLFRRAVPGFRPSEQAYHPKLLAEHLVSSALAEAVRLGELNRAADTEAGRLLLIGVVAGIASLHEAGDARAGFDVERYVSLIQPALDMYTAYFAPEHPQTQA